MMQVINQTKHDNVIAKIRIHPAGSGFLTLSSISDELCYWKISRAGNFEIVWKRSSATSPIFRTLDATFSPDGSLIASVGRGRVIELIDVTDGQLIQKLGRLTKKQSIAGYSACCFAQDGRSVIASQAVDTQLTELYDVISRTRFAKLWRTAVQSFAIHPEGKLVAALMRGMRTCSIRFFSISDQAEVFQHNVALTSNEPLQGLRFSPQGQFFSVIGGIPPLITHTVEFPSMKVRHRFAVNQNIDPDRASFPVCHRLAIDQGYIYDEQPLVDSLVFTDGGDHIVFPDAIGGLYKWNLVTNECADYQRVHSAIITSVDISYRNGRFVSSDLNGIITLWQTPANGGRGVRYQNHSPTDEFFQLWPPTDPKKSVFAQEIEIVESKIKNTKVKSARRRPG